MLFLLLAAASLINTRLRNVGMKLIDYYDAGKTFSTMLSNLRSNAEAAALREQTKADLVALITRETSFVGCVSDLIVIDYRNKLVTLSPCLSLSHYPRRHCLPLSEWSGRSRFLCDVKKLCHWLLLVWSRTGSQSRHVP